MPLGYQPSGMGEAVRLSARAELVNVRPARSGRLVADRHRQVACATHFKLRHHQIFCALPAASITMAAMSDAYNELLDATIQHLEALKTQGVRFVSVSPESLTALAQPPRKSNPSPIVAASRPIVPVETPRVQPSASLENGKVAAFAELRARAMGCVKCPHLAASRKHVVFGVGSIEAKLMFVGEAPGADEDEQGEPFVGKAGQLLTKIIQTMGFQRDSVYIANILKCRPDTPGESAGNRKPTPSEMETCIPYLHEQIDLIQPQVLVALGGTAVEG